MENEQMEKTWEEFRKFSGKGETLKVSLKNLIADTTIDPVFRKRGIDDFISCFIELPGAKKDLHDNFFRTGVIEAIKKHFSKVVVPEGKPSLERFEKSEELIERYQRLVEEILSLLGNEEAHNLLGWFCRQRVQNFDWQYDPDHYEWGLNERIRDSFILESKIDHGIMACMSGPPLPDSETEIVIQEMNLIEVCSLMRRDEVMKEDEEEKLKTGYKYKDALRKFSEAMFRYKIRGTKSSLKDIKLFLLIANKTTPLLLDHMIEVVKGLIKDKREGRELAWSFIKHNFMADPEKTKDSLKKIESDLSIYEIEDQIRELESLLNKLPALKDSELGKLLSEKIILFKEIKKEKKAEDRKKKKIKIKTAKTKNENRKKKESLRKENLGKVLETMKQK